MYITYGIKFFSCPANINLKTVYVIQKQCICCLQYMLQLEKALVSLRHLTLIAVGFWSICALKPSLFHGKTTNVTPYTQPSFTFC